MGQRIAGDRHYWPLRLIITCAAAKCFFLVSFSTELSHQFRGNSGSAGCIPSRLLRFSCSSDTLPTFRFENLLAMNYVLAICLTLVTANAGWLCPIVILKHACSWPVLTNAEIFVSPLP